jgi:hypothetical protein
LKTTIILPSIRVPLNLKTWVLQLEPETDEIIVAGNEASPHAAITEFLGQLTKDHGVMTTYLGPRDPRVTEKAIFEFIPPNHTSRRNFALLQALENRPDVLVTIDDDNYPYKADWLRGVKTLLDLDQRNHRTVIGSETGWWNVGRLCTPRVIHRGYPMTRWTEPDTGHIVDTDATPIGVVASLWLDDPDINAVERMLTNPQVLHVSGSATLAKGTWCPFDSQSTSVHGMLADMMFMWPDLGRYDDIWSSYLMRAVMDVTDWYVTYGTPAVTQDRNAHNLVRDLRDELFGYEHTEEFTDFLRELVKKRPAGIMRAPYSVYEHFMRATAANYKRLPALTRDSFYAWLTDLNDVQKRTGM